MNEKKLYRLEEGKMLCGVCAGLADYFNVDPTIVRLIWVAASLMGAAGLLIYFIATLIIPKYPG